MPQARKSYLEVVEELQQALDDRIATYDQLQLARTLGMTPAPQPAQKMVTKDVKDRGGQEQRQRERVAYKDPYAAAAAQLMTGPNHGGRDPIKDAGEARRRSGR